MISISLHNFQMNISFSRDVCFDDENKIFFDAVLTKVNARRTTYRFYVFAKLQVNRDTSLDLLQSS